MSEETPQQPAPEAAPVSAPAPVVADDVAPAGGPVGRLTRLGTFILDAAFLSLALLPAWKVAHEQGLGLSESTEGQFGVTVGLVAAVLGLVLLGTQWLLAAGGATLGARMSGVAAQTASGASPGLLRAFLRRSVIATGGPFLAFLWLFVAVVAPGLGQGPDTLLGLSKLAEPPPTALVALEWAPRALLAAWLLQGLSALFGGRTLADRVAGLVWVHVGADHRRAFAPPRFSGEALGGAVLGLLVAGAAAGGTFAALTATAAGESTELDVPLVVSALVLVLGIAASGVWAALAARRFVVGELAFLSLLAALVGFELMATRTLFVPSLQRFDLPGWLDYGVYSVATYFALVTFLVLGSAVGFMLTGDQGIDASTRFERLVARRHLRLKASHWLQLAFIATLAPILVYGVVIWPVLAVARLVRAKPVGKPLAPTVFMALLTIVGIMFGVMSLIVVLSVMRGFELDLKDKILGTNAHGVIHRYVGDFTEWREVSRKASTVAGVEGITPFILGEVMITTETDVSGAVLKGIDVETAGKVTDLEKNIEPGNGRLRDLTYPDRIPLSPAEREDLDASAADAGTPGEALKEAVKQGEADADADAGRAEAERAEEAADTQGGQGGGEVLPGIVIGKEMADSLRVGVGNKVTVVNPLGELGPNGPIPRARVFRIAAVFYSGMYEYDSKFSYIDLREAQRFYRMKDGVTGLELRFKNVDDARALMKKVYGAIEGFPYRTKDWGEMNRNLFSALRLERVVMFILLSFQVLIACICVIATLVMLVVEKRKEVATLKSIGARESSIMKLFVIEGLIIGAIGTIYGETAGYVFCKLIEKYGVGLDPSVYYITRLPVVIELDAFVSVGVVAMVLVFVATLYPARRGGSIAPVEGFREE